MIVVSHVSLQLPYLESLDPAFQFCQYMVYKSFEFLINSGQSFFQHILIVGYFSSFNELEVRVSLVQSVVNFFQHITSRLEFSTTASKMHLNNHLV